LAIKFKRVRKNTRRSRAIKSRQEAWHNFRRALQLLGMLFAVATASLLFLFIHDFFTQWDKFNAQEIRVEGHRRLTYENVLSQAGIHQGMNILSANLSACRRRLLENPWIAQASVARTFPNSLNIRISEHEPIAVVDLGKRYLLSSSGILFKEWDKTDPDHLPLISGLTFLDLNAPGEPWSTGFSAVMEVLSLGNSRSPILSNADIDRIEVDPHMGLTLIAFEGKKKIRLGYQDFELKFHQLGRVFFHFKQEITPGDFEIIDVHDVNRIVVKPAENEETSEDGEEV
jgi:cell division protein FtsQ